MGVILYPASSSMISHIGHDAQTGTLTILFQSGKRYEYSGVALDVFEGLRTASSVESFFREEIDGCSPYQQVRGRR